MTLHMDLEITYKLKIKKKLKELPEN